MAERDDVWIPLVDEPIGSIVATLEAEDPEIGRLVVGPQRKLAFRTLAYIRVGVLLGRLLVEHDLEPYDGTGTWVDQLLRDPGHRARVQQELLAVAKEVSDPRYDRGEPIGPDEATRARFREFVKSRFAG
jgi:hypothetical protein